MSDNDPVEKTESQLKALSDVLETGAMQHARRMLNELSPAEIADLLESLPYSERNLLWDLVKHEKEGEVLLEVGDEVRATLIRDMPLDDLVIAPGRECAAVRTDGQPGHDSPMRLDGFQQAPGLQFPYTHISVPSSARHHALR